MPITRFFIWLKLKRERELEERKFMAALHRCKLQDSVAQEEANIVGFLHGAGFGRKISFKGVKVSKEEKERRRRDRLEVQIVGGGL